MIGLTNIKKSYRDGERDINVLNGVSLKIDDGQTLSIMGRSGCGKSTLLHILGGIEHIDGGTYNFDGISMEKCTKVELARIRSTKIGFVFQSYFLIKSLNCIDNVELPLGYVGVKAKERKERALTALEYVGLADYAERNITKLSGGQQQRIAIARAIVSSPSLILADEPTGNLDSETADYTMGLLVELAKRNKSTLIVVTHDTHIASYTDKKYVMKNDGQIYIQ